MTPPRVCIVVLACNRREDTLECLRSLARITDPIPTVILVDNGSSDGTADAVKMEFPGSSSLKRGKTSDTREVTTRESGRLLSWVRITC